MEASTCEREGSCPPCPNTLCTGDGASLLEHSLRGFVSRCFLRHSSPLSSAKICYHDAVDREIDIARFDLEGISSSKDLVGGQVRAI